LQLPSQQTSSDKLRLGVGIVLLHIVFIYFFINSRHARLLEEPSLLTELHFISTPTVIVPKTGLTQEPRKHNPAPIVSKPVPPSQIPNTPTTNTSHDTSHATTIEARITAPDFDQMLEQQKQQRQQSQQLNIDHGRLAKEIESKGQRTLEFAPKTKETALQKLKKGYDSAAPYVEYESKSYTRPDGSRVTKVISNKGTSCVRANRPFDRIDNPGPRLWKVEC
jgi:hypothetical protein